MQPSLSEERRGKLEEWVERVRENIERGERVIKEYDKELEDLVAALKGESAKDVATF